jgi:hypothetical protein
MLANLRSGNHKNNSIFDESSIHNRDNIFAPYIKLKDSFRNAGVILNTPDVNKGKKVDFEIHMDYQEQSDSNVNFLLLYENPEIYPSNETKNLKKYKKIFTWNDSLIDNQIFFKIYIPNTVPKNMNFRPFSKKNYFCTIIASHKTLPFTIKNNLYKERLKSIKWISKYYPKSILIFGDNWDVSFLPHFFNKKPIRYLVNKYYRFTCKHRFESYQGKLEKKSEVLNNSKFALCYENLSGLNGYVTEKIFDCFFNGCIPIYWGAENINQLIPKNCFIDRRNFKNNESLFKYLLTIKEADYNHMQNQIKSFIYSKAMDKFSSNNFANILVNKILLDFAK